MTPTTTTTAAPAWAARTTRARHDLERAIAAVQPLALACGRAEARAVMRAHGITRGLLTTSSAKLDKPGPDAKRRLAVLFLAPATLSGAVNVCPSAGSCARVCLNTAGRGGIGAGSITDIKRGTRTNAHQRARIRRTRALVADPMRFAAALAAEILALARRGPLAVRLNGTSDLDWRPLQRAVDAILAAKNAAPIVWYDYTKRAALYCDHVALPERSPYGRTALAYSYDPAHVDGLRIVREVCAAGGTAAVCFDVPRGAPLPPHWHGIPVIDGDTHDQRWTDPGGVIVGLRAKGRARGSRFAVRTTTNNPQGNTK